MHAMLSLLGLVLVLAVIIVSIVFASLLKKERAKLSDAQKAKLIDLVDKRNSSWKYIVRIGFIIVVVALIGYFQSTKTGAMPVEAHAILYLLIGTLSMLRRIFAYHAVKKAVISDEYTRLSRVCTWTVVSISGVLMLVSVLIMIA